MRNWIIVLFAATLIVGCKSTETQAPAPIDEQPVTDMEPMPTEVVLVCV